MTEVLEGLPFLKHYFYKILSEYYECSSIIRIRFYFNNKLSGSIFKLLNITYTKIG